MTITKHSQNILSRKFRCQATLSLNRIIISRLLPRLLFSLHVLQAAGHSSFFPFLLPLPPWVGLDGSFCKRIPARQKRGFEFRPSPDCRGKNYNRRFPRTEKKWPFYGIRAMGRFPIYMFKVQAKPPPCRSHEKRDITAVQP